MKLKGTHFYRKVITQNYWVDTALWYNIIPALYLELRLHFNKGYDGFNNLHHELVIAFLVFHFRIEFHWRPRKDKPITDWI